MQKYLLSSIAVAALAGATIAVAQPATPAPAAPVAQPAPPAMPGHTKQPQTRNGVVEKVRQHFAQLDTNRDGYLTKAEADAGRAAFKGKRGQWAGRGGQGDRPDKDHGATFDRLDTNHDGTISREEFDRGHQQRQAIRVMHHGGGMGMGGRMFDQADTNHDARVSLKEATDAALKHFDMADINRDGTLTPEERQQMRTKMKEVHRVTRAS